MKPLYDLVSANDDINVRIMPIPYYDCNPFGEIGECHDESEYFKCFDGYTSFIGYELDKRHPDIAVIQVPFDGYSCAMKVPKHYYSDELLKSCDELWYVPCFDPDPPKSPDDKSAVAISVLVEQPAVINADRIILNNKEMRSFYIEKLTGMAGEDTKAYWEGKIKIFDKISDNT